MKTVNAELVSQFNTRRFPLYKIIPLRALSVIYVEQSGSCNLKCKFSPQGSGTTIKKSLIIEIVKYVREKHVFQRMELVINRILLNDLLIRNLPLYLNRIIISMEGLDGDYQRISNTKIDFTKLINYITSEKHRFRKKVLQYQVCVQIFKSLHIHANGNVIRCCVDCNRVNLLGNMTEDSLFDIWNGRKYLEHVKTVT